MPEPAIMLKKHHIFIEEEANLDIADAYDFYASKSNLLGERFLDALDDVYAYLEKSPRIFKTVEKGFLQVPLKVFPYVVLFKIYDFQIVIFRVFHTSQNPKNRL